MRSFKRYKTRDVYGVVLIMAGILVVLAATDTLAQGAAINDISIISNGGDNRSIESGEMYSTVGEPIVSDSISALGNESTWTGFWQVTPTPTSGVREVLEPLVAGATGIAHVAPDPFTTSVAIEVPLARPAHVSLALYDMLGRQVALLAEGRREAGTLRIEWSPEGIDAGSYLLHLSIDGEHRDARLVRYFK